MDIKLVKGRRYLFHNQKFQFRFRANFIDIITRGDGFKTLRVDKYIYESSEKLLSELVAMPFSWIDKIETLDDIINISCDKITNTHNTCSDQSNFVNKIAHIRDVLLEIDSFL